MRYGHVMRHVTDFAVEGLRTLVIADRRLKSPDEYDSLLSELQEARGRIGPERQASIDRIYAKIESNFTLLGITGIEDRLQPGVRKCLRSLRAAGIQVWTY
ncbi:unnamed protein product [Protopolystoma xenopodis]|uniref:Uncharacterized protein n=1 Tax=Protopolystoma xenopodis TaxID=117903 RepID=A0A448WE88_9PLAT|nr:unnamed protein product [Protopolystoma xenopodis]